MSDATTESRLMERVQRAVKLSLNQEIKPEKRAIAAAYLTVHKRLPEFWLAMVRHPNFKDASENDEAFNLSDWLVHPPARWEFQHINVFGDVSDAMMTAGRYSASKNFIAVHPIEPTDPWNRKYPRVPYLHKPTSRFRISYERRAELKHAMGSKFRSLVQFARGRTKKDFLEQFRLPPPDRTKQKRQEFPGGMVRWLDISPYKSKLCVHLDDGELLKRTGYTPEEFWREIHHPRTVTPKFPQLTLI